MTVVQDEARSNQARTNLVLDGHSLKIEDVAAVARHRQPIQLHADACARIDKCRGLLERKILAHEVMYGVNLETRIVQYQQDYMAAGFRLKAP